MDDSYYLTVHDAIAIGDIEILKELIKKRKRTDMRDHIDGFPLHAAVQKNRKDMVQVLLSHSVTDVNCRAHGGRTSLWLACEATNPDLDIVMDLLNHGANPNIPNNENIGPVHLACVSGNLELLQLLIRHQANVNSQGLYGYTPLHCAINSNWPEIVQCLLAHNADANLRETDGFNALMFAIDRNSDIFELLLPYTHDLEAATKDGCTALLLAIRRYNESAVRVLLERGASLTYHGKHSALMDVLSTGSFELFALVWQHTDLRSLPTFTDLIRFLNRYEEYRYYEIILNKPGVELLMNGDSGIFRELFKYKLSRFSATKSQHLNVVGKLLDRGAQLQMADTEQILLYFGHCSYAMELWQTIFAKTTPDVSQSNVGQAIKYKNYDLALLLVTYCLHFKPTCVADLKCKLNSTFLRRWLALFTPASQDRRIILARPSCRRYAGTAKILNDMKGVKSLLELSRDGVRQAMQASCRTTQDFLVALENLEIPTQLKDIIRLRTPVNGYLLEDQ